MKYKGKRPSLNIEYAVIPRSGEEPIVFYCKAILDLDLFSKLCPQPEPPTMVKANGEKIKDASDPKFAMKFAHWLQLQADFFVLQSIKDTPGLEWETINLENPDTWANWRTELKDACFTNSEINAIVNKVHEANSLNEERLEEAHSSFLASLVDQQNQLASQTLVQ